MDTISLPAHCSSCPHLIWCPLAQSRLIQLTSPRAVLQVIVFKPTGAHGGPARDAQGSPGQAVQHNPEATGLPTNAPANGDYSAPEPAKGPTPAKATAAVPEPSSDAQAGNATGAAPAQGTSLPAMLEQQSQANGTHKDGLGLGYSLFGDRGPTNSSSWPSVPMSSTNHGTVADRCALSPAASPSCPVEQSKVCDPLRTVLAFHVNLSQVAYGP